MINEYRYNEGKYAKEILDKGFITKYHMYELKVLAKYYKHIGYKPAKRKELIYEFCEKRIEKFNKVKYYEKINAVLSYARGNHNKLIIIENILITDTEFNYINNLDILYDYKKFLFTMLVFHKIYKETCRIRYDEANEFHFFGGSQKQFDEVLESSNIGDGYKSNAIVKILAEKGLVEIRTKAKIKLLFINEIEESDVILIDIKKFDNIGYYFDYQCGSNKVKKCEKCDILFKAKSNSHKMCKDCWKAYRNNYQKELMRKIRN